MPLIGEIKTKSDNYSSLDLRNLDFIIQFRNDIRHIKCSENILEEILSEKYFYNNISADIDFEYIATFQKMMKN